MSFHKIESKESKTPVAPEGEVVIRVTIEGLRVDQRERLKEVLTRHPQAAISKIAHVLRHATGNEKPVTDEIVRIRGPVELFSDLLSAEEERKAA